MSVLGNHKILNIPVGGDPVSRAAYSADLQLVEDCIRHMTALQTNAIADDYECDAAFQELADEQSFVFIPIVDNTGAATIDVNGLGALALCASTGDQITGAGAIRAYHPYLLTYDSALDGAAGGWYCRALSGDVMPLGVWDLRYVSCGVPPRVRRDIVTENVVLAGGIGYTQDAHTSDYVILDSVVVTTADELTTYELGDDYAIEHYSSANRIKGVKLTRNPTGAIPADDSTVRLRFLCSTADEADEAVWIGTQQSPGLGLSWHGREGANQQMLLARTWVENTTAEDLVVSIPVAYVDDEIHYRIDDGAFAVGVAAIGRNTSFDVTIPPGEHRVSLYFVGEIGGLDVVIGDWLVAGLAAVPGNSRYITS